MERNIWEFRIRKTFGSKENTWIAISISFVLIAWGLTPFLLHGFTAGRGTFGDMYGSVNALFSGLAFCGLVYAILLQQKELSLTRNELALTRIEFSGQKDALHNQSSAMERDLRYSNIFARVDISHKLRDGFSFTNNSTAYSGVSGFTISSTILLNRISSGNANTGYIPTQGIYSDFIDQKWSGLDPIVKSVESTLEYISTLRRAVLQEELDDLVQIYSSQFSQTELIHIYIYTHSHSHSHQHFGRLRVLSQEFQFFKPVGMSHIRLLVGLKISMI